MIVDHQPMNGARMARKIETVFTDDLDGSVADATIRFGLDGTDYEIDLNTAHAEQLRETADRYIQAGRKVGGVGRKTGRSTARRSGPSSSEVREWAKDQGYEVKERGRIPAELVVKFQAATDV
jgi:Lsr2